MASENDELDRLTRRVEAVQALVVVFGGPIAFFLVIDGDEELASLVGISMTVFQAVLVLYRNYKEEQAQS